jgi:hypothetical protein
MPLPPAPVVELVVEPLLVVFVPVPDDVVAEVELVPLLPPEPPPPALLSLQAIMAMPEARTAHSPNTR